MKYISLFSGIEAASVAWEPLGWEPVAYAEVEPFPCAVLAHRYPDVVNLGDVTKVDWSKYRGAVDLIVGGSPCQSFSVAGLRKGLADPRGNLMLEFLRAAYEVDPEWVLWENVPGVLSSHGGRDFAAFQEAVAELWPDGGMSWRILDAQFFGVAQRRRRIFAVINTRDWRRAAAVLQDAESLRGRPSQSREERARLARTVGYCAPFHRVWDAEGGPSEHVGAVEAFKYHQGADSRSIGYDVGLSPTLSCDHMPCVNYDKTTEATDTLQFDTTNLTHHDNKANPQWNDPAYTLNAQQHVPSVALRTAQTGANGLGVSEEATHTLDASGPESVMVQTQYGQDIMAVSMQDKIWGRKPGNDPHGDGTSEELSYTLTAIDRHKVLAPIGMEDEPE